MTVRFLTEITDMGADGDTVTRITIGRRGRLVQVVYDSWAVGEREPGSARECELDIDDARALRDALAAAVRDVEAMPSEDAEEGQ